MFLLYLLFQKLTLFKIHKTAEEVLNKIPVKIVFLTFSDILATASFHQNVFAEWQCCCNPLNLCVFIFDRGENIAEGHK